MTTYPKAQFTKLSDEYMDGEWPSGRRQIVTQIDGDLADKIRDHYGKTGIVTLVEDGAEGGHSEYTIEWYWDCELRIGDEKVWGRDDEVWGRDDEVSEIDPVDGCDYYINNFMKLITEIVEATR